MRSNSIVIIFFLIGLQTLISCGKDQKNQDEMELNENRLKMIKSEAEFVFPDLDNNSKSQVSKWAVFEDFDYEIRTMNRRSKEELRIKSLRLVTHMDSLSKKIPEDLSNRAIKSRLLVVKTRVHLLDQELNKSMPDSSAIQGHISELFTSYSNLIQQINEKLEKDAIDAQRVNDERKELEKQRRFLDSVYKSELQDQVN